MTRTDFVPGIAVLRGYRREWLRGDVLAGVTVAAYLIPQVMAYAQIAGAVPTVRAHEPTPRLSPDAPPEAELTLIVPQSME